MNIWPPLKVDRENGGVSSNMGVRLALTVILKGKKSKNKNNPSNKMKVDR